MHRLTVTAIVCVAAMTMAATSMTFAQPAAAPAPSGHWEGTIDVPGQPIAIQVDLAKLGEKWDGAITMPSQNIKGLPLSNLQLSEETANFAILNAPGNPSFSGRVAKDGKSITGTFSQGGGSTPFQLKRTGEARLEAPPKSTPITKELEGSWAGTLDADGTLLRLALKLTNDAKAGAATGSMISLDQNGVQIPLTSVVQKDTHVTLILRPINGTYVGDLKDGQLVGTWTQGPKSRPLIFKRAN